jgi:hypothetical protein
MTDITNGWPGKPGVPLNPKEDEPHWLSWRDEKPRAVEWDSQSLAPVEDEDKQGFWRFGDLYGTPEQVAADGWRYLGPCLTPDEAAALQKRVVELEGAQGRLILSFRLNLLRLNPRLSHETISKAIEVALTGGKDE